MRFALGRVPNDPRKPRVRLRALRGVTLTPPVSVDYVSRVSQWPMNYNDQIGSCTAAGASHAAQMVNMYGQGKNAPVSDADVLTMYSAISGYDPKTGRNDNGATLQDALGYWHNNGLGGNKIAAYAQIDHTNLDLIRNCIAVFGSVYTGFNVPSSAMDQFDTGQPWTVVTRSRIEGGHCVPLMAYDSTSFTCVTWAKTQKLDLAFLGRYFDEIWVPIDLDWLTAAGTSPAGLDTSALNADYTALTGQPGPFQQVTPVPPVVVPPPVTPPAGDATALLGSLRDQINTFLAG